MQSLKLVTTNTSIPKFLYHSRVLSATIASAILAQDVPDQKRILAVLSLPDIVKVALQSTLRTYLEDIKIAGFEKRKKRKVFIVGNTGNLILNDDYMISLLKTVSF